MSSKKQRRHHPRQALSAAKVRTAEPGMHADGNCLYLQVDDSGARRWIQRLIVNGHRRDIGLGGVSYVPLAEARSEAARLRAIARKGGDPLAERRAERRIVPTFEAAARKVHESIKPTFRNAKHAAQWISSLETYAFPVIGSRPVNQIESADVLTVLSPIWTQKAETARRVKQRMRSIFDWAKAAGFRAGDNPVEGVNMALPNNEQKKKHHPALPYAAIPEFLEQLHNSEAGLSVQLGLEFLILTATRTSEVLYAKWDEIDIAGKRWKVPEQRMKAKEQHEIPLVTRTLEILEQARLIHNGGEYIFPGRTAKKPLSNMAFLMALRDMDRAEITVHGFRSSFRDFCEEKTKAKRSVIEAAMAHTNKNKVEAAYLRSKLYDQRIPLMEAWAAYATVKGGKVIKMASA